MPPLTSADARMLPIDRQLHRSMICRPLVVGEVGGADNHAACACAKLADAERWAQAGAIVGVVRSVDDLVALLDKAI